MLNLGNLRPRKAAAAPAPTVARNDAHDQNGALEDHELEHVAGGRNIAWRDDLQSLRYDPGTVS